MAIPTLSGSYIDETYGRLVQVSGSEFADGLGNPISIVVGSHTGSFITSFQTSSMTVLSSSFASQADHAQTADYATNAGNGGVTKITAGAGITLVPNTGLGDVTIIASGSIVPYDTTRLDLSDLVYYDIPYSGIFEIVNANGQIAFPNPETHNGGTIIIVNTTDQPASINNENGWAPLRSGTGTTLDAINGNEMWNFISIGAKWRGILGVL